jgi:hypothetical protein
MRICRSLDPRRRVEIWFETKRASARRTDLDCNRRGEERGIDSPQNAYLFGDIRPRQGRCAGIADADTEAMQLHLEEIRRDVSVGAHPMLPFGRASSHRLQSRPHLKSASRSEVGHLPAFGMHAGTKYRMLNLVDEFTHECLAIRVDPEAQIPRLDRRVVRLFIMRGVPERIRSDNGPMFVAKAVQD